MSASPQDVPLHIHIDAVATFMQSVAVLMESHADSAEMLLHARELAGAAEIARGWARGIGQRRVDGR
jgi:hypothetical protein